MNNNAPAILIRLLICLPAFFASCGGNDKKVETIDPNQPVKIKADTSKTDSGTAARRPPIINIVDTVILPQTILYIKDSASSSERISAKMSDLFRRRIPAILAQLQIEVDGPPMVWYRSQQAPFFFEAGQAIKKKPAKLPKPFLIKTLTKDSAVVAHFFGPYDITIMGYEALNDWMKDHKKKKTGPSYEIYVGNPYDAQGKKLDPYRVQTDIVFPHN